jgi:hypothetical protein
MVVVCTYFWQPDPGSKFAAPYTPDDVRLLQRMVARHLTVPHEFVVITDQPEAFVCDQHIRAVDIDKRTHVPGTCFVRLFTFCMEAYAMIGDRVLQLDLDTIIVGNMDHLVTRTEDLVLWRNPARHPSRPGRALYNTSLLLHKCGSMPELWQCFLDLGKKVPAKDDQWYLSDALGPYVPYFDGVRDGVYRLARADTPGSGVDGELPANACVVTFPGSHGKHDRPEVLARNRWISEHLR